MSLLIGGLTLAVWIYLLAARGAFWRAREAPAPETGYRVEPLPAIVAIIPARNEAQCVGQAIQSLAAQDYPGNFRIVLVDDDSSDGTASVARTAAESAGARDRLTVVKARLLEKGWTGKLWAISEGLHTSASLNAEYFLLTDADVAHAPDNVSILVKRAEQGSLDLASLMVKLESRTPAERALIPAFVFFFFLLYPPAWVASENRKTAAAAGGCILIRAEALRRIGGIAAIRGELIDDCALASAVKRTGGRIWLGLTSSTHSIRGYGGFGDIERMIARTAFTQLRHSSVLLAGTIAGMALTYIAPPLLAIFGNSQAAVLGGIAWALMAALFMPMLRFYGRLPLWAPFVPMIAVFYLVATLDSAIGFWRGRGGLWKGRVQDRRD